MKKTILRGTLALTWAVACLAGTGLSAGLAAQEAQELREIIVSGISATRPILGVYLGIRTDLPFEVRPESAEPVVTQLVPGGPAEEVGIQVGDIIVSIDGHRVTEPLPDEDETDLSRDSWPPQRRLRTLVQSASEGESVEVVVERNGEAMTFTLVPMLYPENPAPETRLVYSNVSRSLQDVMNRSRLMSDSFLARRSVPEFRVGRVPGVAELRARMETPSLFVYEPGDPWRRFQSIGNNLLEMVELNPELGSYFGTEVGVLVLDVDEESTMGLRPGDVVVAISGREVDEVSDIRRILASYEEDEKVDFGIWRDGAQLTVVGTIR